MSKTKLVTNPAINGPGIWQFLHIKSRHAQSDASKNAFIDDMYMLSVEFTCNKCRTHIQEYLREHSFDPYFNLTNEKGEQIGMFKWAWTFHNAVNLRLGKPFVDWETAWEMYDTGREVCTNCSSSRPSSQANSVETSYEDSFEKEREREKTERKKTNSTPIYVDKKKIIQGYFLKKALQ